MRLIEYWIYFYSDRKTRFIKSCPSRNVIFQDLTPIASNTAMEIMPVCKVDSANYKVGAITKLLHEAYKENVKTYLAKTV